PGGGPRREDGYRCDGEVAGGNLTPVGKADRDGRRSEAPRRRAVEGARPLVSSLAVVDPREERVHRRVGFRRLWMVDDHDHHVALAGAIEHVAADRPRLVEEPGLDVRAAGDALAAHALPH